MYEVKAGPQFYYSIMIYNEEISMNTNESN